MILVTGATGTVGSEVLACLLPARAGQVRALTRNPDAVFLDGVERVVGDLGGSDLSSVLSGVDAVFLLTDGLNITEHDRRLATAAARAGVQRIVKLSALSVGHGATDPITTWHRAGERAIRDNGLGWTFLRPTAFMSNALNWAPTVATHYVVHAPFAAGRTAVVDPADIGAVAAACLTQDGHDRQIYELTGPEPLSPPDQVDILARVLGRTVSYVEADPADVLHQMTSDGMPAELAHAVVELLRSSQEPFNSEPTPDIKAVTGRPARSFSAWADAHRAAFLNVAATW
jgi:(4-alkanoyl-5-oxo-2,5-dihydrofuran-3-yl)methyl phosphate reductase